MKENAIAKHNSQTLDKLDKKGRTCKLSRDEKGEVPTDTEEIQKNHE